MWWVAFRSSFSLRDLLLQTLNFILISLDRGLYALVFEINLSFVLLKCQEFLLDICVSCLLRSMNLIDVAAFFSKDGSDQGDHLSLAEGEVLLLSSR